MKFLSAGLLAGIMLLLAVPAQAAGSATLITTGLAGGVRLDWLDIDHIRVDVRNQPGHLLLLKNRSYHVASIGGQPVATPLTVLARLIGPQNLPRPPQTAANAREVLSIKSDGYTFNVANIDGKIYDITWTDNAGGEHTDLAVLTKNATATELTRVLRRVANVLSRVAQIENSDVLGRTLEDRGLGLLHFADQLRVKSLSGASPPVSAFALP